ncbi:MAG: hypothetical protein AB1714_31150 [Acidobacteriota bacterium]
MKTLASILAALVAFVSVAAAEQYVTDPAVNTTLHTIENTWNRTYGNSGGEPDITGTFPDIKQSYTSPSGTTIKLVTDDVMFEIDFGSLDFSPLDPIQEHKCAFEVTVNKIEGSGTGTVTVNTAHQDYEYTCDKVTMGIKNFSVTGNVSITDTGVAFSSIVLHIDQNDYYFTFPCAGGPTYYPELQEETDGGLPSNYRTLLVNAMKAPGSQFSTVCRSKTLQSMKSYIREIEEGQ